MKGYAIVQKSKERKMERKAKHKALSVEKTVKSRQRRLDNKAKRAEIHAIDPDMKVIIKDQVTYNDDGAVIKVDNGKVSIWLSLAVPEVFKPEPEEYKKGRTIDDQIEKERLGVLNPFRWKKKLTL